MFFDQLRINAFNSLNVRKGDFVTVVGNSAWFEVTNDPPAESSLLNVASNELVLKSNVSAVHFQNDPWDYAEVNFAYTSQGYFKRNVPDQLKYQGTFTIAPWLWYYNNRNCEPATPKDFNLYLHAIGLNSPNNVDWKDLDNVKQQLKKIKINRWSVVVNAIPNVAFNKTVLLKDIMFDSSPQIEP